MVTDPPTRLVTVIILTMAIDVTLTTTIPKLLLASKGNGHDAEDKAKFDTTGTDQNPMVLKTETTKENNPLFIEFSYSDESKNQLEKTEDAKRYSYRMIDSREASAGKSVATQGVDGSENVKNDKEKQNHYKGSEERGVLIFPTDVRRQTEFEENVPGSHNWPKHMPDHLKPLSPFDEDEDVISKAQSFTPGRQAKRDDGFVLSERFPPPPRAGPYLYPQSLFDREFRVPYN